MESIPDALYYRIATALKRAQRLADQTRRLIEETRRSAHAARNARHHAGLVRTLAKIRRARAA